MDAGPGASALRRVAPRLLHPFPANYLSAFREEKSGERMPHSCRIFDEHSTDLMHFTSRSKPRTLSFVQSRHVFHTSLLRTSRTPLHNRLLLITRRTAFGHHAAPLLPSLSTLTRFVASIFIEQSWRRARADRIRSDDLTSPSTSSSSVSATATVKRGSSASTDRTRKADDLCKLGLLSSTAPQQRTSTPAIPVPPRGALLRPIQDKATNTRAAFTRNE